MRPAPNSYTRKEKKEQKELEDAKKSDEFAWLVQTELEKLLKMQLEPKDKNFVIANAIKYIVVRNKIGGDDDGFWGGD